MRTVTASQIQPREMELTISLTIRLFLATVLAETLMKAA
jgi:hypothetical protein